jgi:hypothetical protein
MYHIAAAFQVMATRVTDQNAPHQLSGNLEEMGAILPFHALVVDQAHVSLVDQGGLQAMTGAFSFHVPSEL